MSKLTAPKLITPETPEWERWHHDFVGMDLFLMPAASRKDVSVAEVYVCNRTRIIGHVEYNRTEQRFFALIHVVDDADAIAGYGDDVMWAINDALSNYMNEATRSMWRIMGALVRKGSDE